MLFLELVVPASKKPRPYYLRDQTPFCADWQRQKNMSQLVSCLFYKNPAPFGNS